MSVDISSLTLYSVRQDPRPDNTSQLSMSLVFVFLLLVHAATSVSVLEIKLFKRAGNTVEMRCERNNFDNEPDILHDVSLFLFNSTGTSVTSLLEDNGIRYDFDSNSDGKLSFEIQQSIEGYYYCSRNMSAGLPDDYRTILGKSIAKCIAIISCLSS